MRVLLLTPPLVQLNTPYPATAYLTGFLRSRGIDARQADPALTWVLRLFSPAGLDAIAAALESTAADSAAARHFKDNEARIRRCVEPVLRLLQNRDLSLVHRIAKRSLLPEGPRFSSLGPSGHETEYLDWAFGQMGIADRARYLASLFLEDLGDVVTTLDPHFGFARYGESLAQSQASLDPLLAELEQERVTGRLLDELSRELYDQHHPDVVGMTLPFPGNVLGGLRMARALKRRAPEVRIVWGGGYVNTELRSLADARLFDFVDAVTYDDGETPLLALLEHFDGARPADRLVRTRLRKKSEVVLCTSNQPDVAWKDTGTPTYDGLPLADYLGMINLLNPMHRLWSDTRWNKLTVAHGCYWKKCTFCDISLDYIARYEPLAATQLVDRIEALIAETGSRGFHFVDEAAPPAGLKALAEELLRRGRDGWWGNIRFEKSFTPELCALLARSGCIALSGGLEAASNRLLDLMKKGVTVEQVARVTHGMSQAGIRVHAYLMYGFATQTVQETVDALEYVRQLFAAGCLDSAFWHRMSVTAHAPLGQVPGEFGLRLLPEPAGGFARNDLAFVDPTGVDHAGLGAGLAKAVYNYMHGLGVEQDVRTWFAPVRVPKTQVARDFIGRALVQPAPKKAKKAPRA